MADLSGADRKVIETHVKTAYADMLKGKANLLNTVQRRVGTKAGIISFPKMDALGDFSEYAGGSKELVPGEVQADDVDVIIKTHRPFKYIDRTQAYQYDVNLVKPVAEALAAKIRNIINSKIINAAASTSTSITGAISSSLISTLAGQFADSEITSERHIVIDGASLTLLLNDPKLTSSDYMQVKALVEGTLDKAFGFNFHVVGGGLLGKTTTRFALAYASDAIGCGIGLDLIETNYIPQRTSTLVTGIIQAGAGIIDEAGVFKLTLA